MIHRDRQVMVTHRPASPSGLAIPGYLFVETQRHVPRLSSLTEDEAVAVARTVWRASRAVERELEPQFVFSVIAGRAVSHFHQHVFVRPRGTPDLVPWNDVDSWDDRPQVTAAELDLLCARLRVHFD